MVDKGVGRRARKTFGGLFGKCKALGVKEVEFLASEVRRPFRPGIDVSDAGSVLDVMTPRPKKSKIVPKIRESKGNIFFDF